MPGCCIKVCLLMGVISVAVFCRAVAELMAPKEGCRSHTICSASCEQSASLMSGISCIGLKEDAMPLLWMP